MQKTHNKKIKLFYFRHNLDLPQPYFFNSLKTVLNFLISHNIKILE